MKNNRNTLLFISGIGHIITSVVCAIVLLIVSLSIEIIDVSLRISIYNSQLYAYKPQLGEGLITLIVASIFIVLSLIIFLSFAAGIININASKSGTNPIQNRTIIIVMAIVSIVLIMPIVYGVLSLCALLVDKNQPDGIKIDEIDNQTKSKINELKKLKTEGTINQKEFIELLSKLLVE